MALWRGLFLCCLALLWESKGIATAFVIPSKYNESRNPIDPLLMGQRGKENQEGALQEPIPSRIETLSEHTMFLSRWIVFDG